MRLLTLLLKLHYKNVRPIRKERLRILEPRITMVFIVSSTPTSVSPVVFLLSDPESTRPAVGPNISPVAQYVLSRGWFNEPLDWVEQISPTTSNDKFSTLPATAVPPSNVLGRPLPRVLRGPFVDFKCRWG